MYFSQRGKSLSNYAKVVPRSKLYKVFKLFYGSQGQIKFCNNDPIKPRAHPPQASAFRMMPPCDVNVEINVLLID